MKREELKKLQKYIILREELGKGSFSTVHRAVLEADRSVQFAVKVTHKSTIAHDKYLQNAFFKEISILSVLNSPYVVKLHEVIQTKNNYYIVQELCEGGTLKSFLKQHGAFPEEQALRLVEDILSGCLQFVRIGIIHRDLKPQNILLTKEGQLKIADFGLARILNNHKKQLMYSRVGSYNYMSPQLEFGGCYTSKSDVWSLGIIVAEILLGRHPFPAKTQSALQQSVLRGVQLGKEVSPQLQDFVGRCLQYEQSARMDWQQVFSHSLFRSKFQAFQDELHRYKLKLLYIANRLKSRVIQQNVDINKLFEEYDLIIDGFLNKVEFFRFLLYIDNTITNDEVLYIFNDFDHNADQKVDKQEFCNWLFQHKVVKYDDAFSQEFTAICKKLQANVEKNFPSCEAFLKKYDYDNDYKLQKEQFSKIIEDIGVQLKPSQMQILFTEFDHNADGILFYHQFQSQLYKALEIPPALTPSDEKRVRDFSEQLYKVMRQSLKR